MREYRHNPLATLLSLPFVRGETMSASETCPAREGTAAEHCWHADGLSVTYGFGPTITPERCCFCGQSRRHIPDPPPIPEGHGPFHPDRHSWLGASTTWTMLGGSFAPVEGGASNNDAESDGA